MTTISVSRHLRQCWATFQRLIGITVVDVVLSTMCDDTTTVWSYVAYYSVDKSRLSPNLES